MVGEPFTNSGKGGGRQVGGGGMGGGRKKGLSPVWDILSKRCLCGIEVEKKV